MRGLLATVVTLAAVSAAPAQYTIQATPMAAVTGSVFQDNIWVYRGYPSGYLCGYSYTKGAFGVQTPDKQWVQPPVAGQVTCVSSDGKWLGGYDGVGTAMQGWRWKVGQPAVERPDAAGSGYQWVRPKAIASDGTAVTEGSRGDGWTYGGAWAAGQAKVVTVPCQYGYLAPTWALTDVYTIEPATGGYAVTGVGQSGANPYSGYLLTGPLPTAVAVAGRPKPRPKPPAGSLASVIGDIPPAVLAQMLRSLLDAGPPPAPKK